jgi:hypothetical protein
MAHLLYAAFRTRGIYLNRTAFVYGNILPDQTPAMWVAPHFSRVCSRRSAEILNTLSRLPLPDSGRVGAEYSKELGIMCHFLCDYFCFAHNADFSAGLKQHVAYENELDAYLRKNCLETLDLDGRAPLPPLSGPRALIARTEALKRAYAEKGHSLQSGPALCFRGLHSGGHRADSLLEKASAGPRRP